MILNNVTVVASLAVKTLQHKHAKSIHSFITEREHKGNVKRLKFFMDCSWTT